MASPKRNKGLQARRANVVSMQVDDLHFAELEQSTHGLSQLLPFFPHEDRALGTKGVVP